MIYPTDALPQSEGLPFHERDYSPGIPNDAKGENVHPQKFQSISLFWRGIGVENSHVTCRSGVERTLISVVKKGTEINLSSLLPVADFDMSYTRIFSG